MPGMPLFGGGVGGGRGEKKNIVVCSVTLHYCLKFDEEYRTSSAVLGGFLFSFMIYFFIDLKKCLH